MKTSCQFFSGDASLLCVTDSGIYRPASAAGIFSSNLGSEDSHLLRGRPDKEAFEAALQSKTFDEDLLYAKQQQESLEQVAKVFPRVIS